VRSFLVRALCVLFLMTAVLSAQPASAHNLWLNATDFTPDFNQRTGAHTKVYFGFGHRFPVHDFLEADKLSVFKLVPSGGDESTLTPGEGGFLATPLILKQAGGYTVCAATKNGYYTMYREGDRIRHKLAGMEGLDNVILSLYFEDYAKALINVGPPAAEDFFKPLGDNIEIVPQENPFLKKVGDMLPLKVLHGGKPAAFCQVSATYVGFSTREDYAYSNKTNSEGISAIRLIHPGQWIVTATVRHPAPESEKGKCLEMKYSASLTFEIP